MELGCESFCLIYLDDVLIFSETWSDRVKRLCMIFERVRSAGLTLKRSKCEFVAAELDYIGHHIGLGQVSPHGNKKVHCRH